MSSGNAWEDVFYEREAWKQQVGENSGRLAFAWGTTTTTGQGEMAYEEVIQFGLAFIEKPMFSYGFELLNRTDFEDDDGGEAPKIPYANGCVYEWDVDGRGLYIGAHVAVTVYCDDVIEIEHHYGFTGLAIKDLDSGGKLAE
jgi:hypothetical protein